MTNCPPSENDRYAKLIRLMVYHLVILAYIDITADLIAYPKLLQLGNYISGLTARKGNMLLPMSDKRRWEGHKHRTEVIPIFLTYGHLISTLCRGRGWIYYIT
jgi:hypothetical protein